MNASHSIEKQVISRIYGKGRGSVFTSNDFKDLGSRGAVALALHRLMKAGTIRRIGNGLYDYPAVHPLLGTLSPDLEKVVGALAGRDAKRIQPTGAYAANLLGLTEQVPMRIMYLTDGPSRKVKVGDVELVLRNTSSRFLATRSVIGGLLIQALRHWGRANTGEREYNLLRSRIPYEGRQELLKDLKAAPAWIADIMRRLAEEPKEQTA